MKTCRFSTLLCSVFLYLTINDLSIFFSYKNVIKSGQVQTAADLCGT